MSPLFCIDPKCRLLLAWKHYNFIVRMINNILKRELFKRNIDRLFFLLYRGYDQTERRGGNFPGFFSYSADFFCTGELQGFLKINHGDFYSFILEGFPTFTELIRTAKYD